MISFPSCIAINLSPVVLASCHQPNDVIVTVTGEGWLVENATELLSRPL